MKSHGKERKCLADRVKDLFESIEIVRAKSAEVKKDVTELSDKQESDCDMLSEAICDLDVVTDERLVDIENALCDLTILLEEGM